MAQRRMGPALKLVESTGSEEAMKQLCPLRSDRRMRHSHSYTQQFSMRYASYINDEILWLLPGRNARYYPNRMDEHTKKAKKN